MADMVDNVVKVSGSDGQLDKFVELMGNAFDFNRIVPMPEKLRNNDYRRLSEEESARFKEEYGYDDWYYWALHNWGVIDTPIEVVVERNDGSVMYKFRTRSGEPYAIYRKLRQMFSDLSIECYYYGFRWVGEKQQKYKIRC